MCTNTRIFALLRDVKHRPIRLHDTVNPFESNSQHLFISKYSLCIYPIRHYISIKPVYIPQQRKRFLSGDDGHEKDDKEPEHQDHHAHLVELAKEPVSPVEPANKPEDDPLPTITPMQPVEPKNEPLMLTRPGGTCRSHRVI